MKDDLLSDLNKEQKEAVIFNNGPLLIVAGAGTGKTTVLTRRIAYLINNGVKPEEILAVTFTEKAAREMEERVESLLPFDYYDFWISTFHSFCDRVLKRHGLSIGIPTNYRLLESAGSWMLIKKNFDKFSFLKEYRPLGNPTKFIQALVSHFSQCKNEGIYPENYIEYEKSLKNDDNDLERIKEVAKAYEVYQQLLLDNNVLDFGDLINYTLKIFEKKKDVLERYRKQFKYIMVDEFQDTNWVQYELIKKLAHPNNNITIVGDDDQCLIGDSKIDILKDKEIKKIKIKNVKKGDDVLTAIGKGHLGLSQVKNISKSKKKTELITVKTKSGNCLTITDNHKMFCMVPSSERRIKNNYHYVYLMYRDDIGWRIGKTDNLFGRLMLERSADSIIGLRDFDSDSEARYYETLWSLKYGIPTSCFCEREGTVIKKELLRKLYEEIDVSKGVITLARDLNIDLNTHHCYLGGVNRGNKKRVKINIVMCSRNSRIKNAKDIIENPKIIHTLNIDTSIKEIIDKLEKAGFKLAKAKNGKKLVISSTDIREIGKKAKELQNLLGGFIDFKFYAGLGLDIKNKKRKNNPAKVIPAKNLLRGHYLPIKRGNDVVYDEIIDIKRESKTVDVYDLEVKGTHNFIAEEIVVHNSIFSFQGSSFNNVLRFKKDYPKSKEIVLIENYRSPQNILDLSYSFIQKNNPNRLECKLNDSEIFLDAEKKGIDLKNFKGISKKLKSNQDKDGIVELLSFEGVDQEITGVVNKIWEIKEIDDTSSFSSFSILTRTNNAADIFSRALERAGIPYQFISSKGLYTDPLIIDLISYLKVVLNFYDSLSFYRVLRLMNFSPEEVSIIIQYSDKKGIPIFESLKNSHLLSKFTSETKVKINKLIKNLNNHYNLSKDRNIGEVFVNVIQDLEYGKYIPENTEDGFRKWELIDQFYEKAKEFENSQADAKLPAFIENIQMELDAGEEGSLRKNIDSHFDAVRIMTVHSAKGLEFDYVFVPYLVSRSFPSDQKRDPIELPDDLIKEVLPQGDFHIQEERRLFYVALTRAKKGMFLTWSADHGGKQLKKPSRFLIESELISEDIIKNQKFERSPGFCIKRVLNFKQESDETNGSGKDLKLFMPDHFSYSQLESFRKCPLEYKLKNILKIPIRGKSVFSFGKTIHAVTHKFVNEAFKREQTDIFKNDLKTLYKIYDEEWISDWYKSAEEQKEFYNKGKEILKNFYNDLKENHNILSINDELALEKGFQLKLNGDVVIGMIDRIDEVRGGVEIIDYKTGSPKKTLSKEDKLQLLIYALAAKNVLGLNPVKLTYYYLEDCSKASFDVKDGIIEKTEEELKELIKKVKRSNFKPSGGWHCQFCDFRDICAHKKK
ncbi:MAG: UvrD-helicase domain-containing protein [archaeon]|jgi:DNA helicase-2/ATP-dependent DNA helicase PcrA